MTNPWTHSPDPVSREERTGSTHRPWSSLHQTGVGSSKPRAMASGMSITMFSHRIWSGSRMPPAIGERCRHR